MTQSQCVVAVYTVQLFLDICYNCSIHAVLVNEICIYVSHNPSHYIPAVSQSSTFAKNAFELRDNAGTCVLFLSAKSLADKEKWLKCFQKEQEIVQRDKESGK